jgi:hypothetical protein
MEFTRRYLNSNCYFRIHLPLLVGKKPRVSELQRRNPVHYSALNVETADSSETLVPTYQLCGVASHMTIIVVLSLWQLLNFFLYCLFRMKKVNRVGHFSNRKNSSGCWLRSDFESGHSCYPCHERP